MPSGWPRPTVWVFSMMLVEAPGVDLLPDLDQVAVGALHQAVEHLDHVEPRAERGIHGAHLQADDAAADHQHLLRHGRSSSAPVESTMRGSSGRNGSCTACEPAAMMALLEADDLLGAGLVLRIARWSIRPRGGAGRRSCRSRAPP
jgi:hypothetical protein